ncbi:MAG TPA: hypothetical protein VGO62_11515, partial [Myxococcota bacterium]
MRASVDADAKRGARTATQTRDRAAQARLTAAAAVGDRPIPKLDADKPVMIISTQSGNATSDKIVKATDKYMKDQAGKNGYQVVDASNLSGAALKKYVSDVVKANPAAFAGKNTVLFTGGHGDIQTNERGQDRHMIAASKDNHTDKQVETVADIVKP